MTEQSSDQKCWDAALIKIWRTNGTLWDAMSLFTALTGKHLSDFDPALKRTPRLGMPAKIAARVFVASYLPKISERLWAQDPEKDVLLLRKLQTSSYDTMTSGIQDNELARTRKQLVKNKKVIELDVHLYAHRNDPTEWGTVKGAVSKTRRGG